MSLWEEAEETTRKAAKGRETLQLQGDVKIKEKKKGQPRKAVKKKKKSNSLQEPYKVDSTEISKIRDFENMLYFRHINKIYFFIALLIYIFIFIL